MGRGGEAGVRLRDPQPANSCFGRPQHHCSAAASASRCGSTSRPLCSGPSWRGRNLVRELTSS